jgi:hypothetical protein
MNAPFSPLNMIVDVTARCLSDIGVSVDIIIC